MTDGVHEQVIRLGEGTNSSSRAWSWIAWAQLGFDVAATGRYAHSCLAVKELWGTDRPVPEALEQFRQGFAGYQQGRRRPELRALAADQNAVIAAMVDQFRWVIAKSGRLPRACAEDSTSDAFDNRPDRRWACLFCPRTSCGAWQWLDDQQVRWWVDMCDTHRRLFPDAIKLTNELFPGPRHLAMADRTVHLEPCDGPEATNDPVACAGSAVTVRQHHSLLAA